MPRRLAAFVVLSLLLVPAAASAHQASVSYSTVTVDDDGTVHYTILLSTRDLYEALDLPGDRDASDAEILAGRDQLAAYVEKRIDVADGAHACPLALAALDVVTQTDRFARLELLARCGKPITTLVVDYDLFFDLDSAHTGMIEVRHAGERVRRDLTAQASRLEWTLAGPPPTSSGVIDFIEHGVEHIFGGYDHIAFLIGLLLVAAIRRAPAPYGFEARGLRDGLVAVLKTVTAFTVAHSITLISAALGWIQLPSRVVESAIAASIVYVAVENIVLDEPRHRWPLALGFGLVHGMGFASVLRPMLPETQIVVPLLAFNVGVELGQLAIVSLLFPILTVLAARGARRYHRVVVIGGSLVIATFGALWLLERTLHVMTLSRILPD